MESILQDRGEWFHRRAFVAVIILFKQTTKKIKLPDVCQTNITNCLKNDLLLLRFIIMSHVGTLNVNI